MRNSTFSRLQVEFLDEACRFFFEGRQGESLSLPYRNRNSPSSQAMEVQVSGSSRLAEFQASRCDHGEWAEAPDEIRSLILSELRSVHSYIPEYIAIDLWDGECSTIEEATMAWLDDLGLESLNQVQDKI